MAKSRAALSAPFCLPDMISLIMTVFSTGIPLVQKVRAAKALRPCCIISTGEYETEGIIPAFWIPLSFKI
jgi:hypothetical protein